MSKSARTTQLVTVALLITIEIILSRICSVFMPTGFRIGLGFLPVAMVAILYGPWWSGAAYALGDIFGFFLFPSGQYMPGFTLTAFLTGMTFGLFLYRHDVTFKRTFAASLTVVTICNLVLDTFWLYLLYDQAIAVLIPMRLLKCAATLGLQVTLIPFIWKRCLLKIPQLRSAVSGR
ncbi:MAG: folate family ECF transporter S component [Clostridia bacterium]|nr:folate family ECF transporter S component [Clostridia bacterium]